MNHSDTRQSMETQLPKQSAFISRSDLSRRWVCSSATIKRWERAGMLQAVKIGPRNVLYKTSDVEVIERQGEVRE